MKSSRQRSFTSPTGPFRCLAMIRSALPIELAFLGFLADRCEFFAMDEHHHVGVLLDGPAFPQVAQLGPMLSLRGFGLAIQLGQAEHGELQISRASPFSRRAILATCSWRGSLAIVGFDELQVVDDDQAEFALRFSRRAQAAISVIVRLGVSSMNMGALLSLDEASISFLRSSWKICRCETCRPLIFPCEQSMRWANSSRDISRLTNSVVARDSNGRMVGDVGGQGRLAHAGPGGQDDQFRSCSPPVMVSRSVKPVGMPGGPLFQPRDRSARKLRSALRGWRHLVGAAAVVNREDLFLGLVEHFAGLQGGS